MLRSNPSAAASAEAGSRWLATVTPFTSNFGLNALNLTLETRTRFAFFIR
jgi:hypothetical protein